MEMLTEQSLDQGEV